MTGLLAAALGTRAAALLYLHHCRRHAATGTSDTAEGTAQPLPHARAPVAGDDGVLEDVVRDGAAEGVGRVEDVAVLRVQRQLPERLARAVGLRRGMPCTCTVAALQPSLPQGTHISLSAAHLPCAVAALTRGLECVSIHTVACRSPTGRTALLL